MSVLLDGIEFVDDCGPNDIFTIGDDGLKGLFDGAAVKGEQVGRPNADGDYSLPSHRTGRVFSLSGLVLTNGLWDQARQLQRLSALGGRVIRMTVEYGGESRWADVTLADSPDVRIVVPGTVASYQIVLRAADPRLYGEIAVFQGSSVQVFHRGNAGAFPVVRVAGPSAGYTLWGPNGRRVVVSQPLTAGQWHDFDFRSGILRRDGVLQMGGLARLEPWTVPPHVKTVMEIVGAPSMAVTVTDTYM